MSTINELYTREEVERFINEHKESFNDTIRELVSSRQDVEDQLDEAKAEVVQLKEKITQLENDIAEAHLVNVKAANPIPLADEFDQKILRTPEGQAAFKIDDDGVWVEHVMKSVVLLSTVALKQMVVQGAGAEPSNWSPCVIEAVKAELAHRELLK